MIWAIYFGVAIVILIIGGIVNYYDKYADDESLGVFIAIAVTWPISLIIIIGGTISIYFLILIEKITKKHKKK